MPDVQSFSDLADEFNAVVSKIIWPSLTTIDRRGRPRTRIVHPLWEGSTAWILTGRSSLKAKHIEQQSPYVAFCYVDLEGVNPAANQVYAECRAEFVDDADEKQRVWELFKSTPEPYGYDPAMFFQGGPEAEDLGLIKCTPWRVEVFSLAGAMSGANKVWRQDV